MNKNDALKMVLEFVEFAGDADESILHYCEDGQIDLDYFDDAVKLLKDDINKQDNKSEFVSPNPKELSEQMEMYLELAYGDLYNYGNSDPAEFELENVSGERVIEMARIIFERVIKVVSEQDELVWSDEEVKRIMESE